VPKYAGPDLAPMEPSGTPRYWIAAWAGIGLLGMMVAAFALDLGIVASTGAEPVLRSDQVGPDLLRASGSPLWPLEGWVYTLMVAPACVFTAGLYLYFRDEVADELALSGLVAAFMFWVVHTMHNAVLLAVLALAPTYAAAGANASVIEGVARGLIAFSDVLFRPGGGVGTLLLAVAGLAFGKVMLDSGRLPRWVGLAAVGAALLGLLGLLQYVFPPFVAFGLIGWVLFIAWVGGASVAMLRGPAAEAAVATGGAADAA